MPRETTKAGMAVKSEQLLNESKKEARQKIIKSTYFRTGESFGGNLPFTNVSVGDKGGETSMSSNSSKKDTQKC